MISGIAKVKPGKTYAFIGLDIIYGYQRAVMKAFKFSYCMSDLFLICLHNNIR